jgi:hypothetical protein
MRGVLAIVAMAALMAAGCSPRRELLPVQGRVLLDGEPLAFGSVSFQSASGQPATAILGPDGSFTMAVFGEGPGAVPGPNRILVTCYEGQRQAAADRDREPSLGRLLIPERYTSYETSGLVIDVQRGMEMPVVLNLSR